MLLNIYGPSGSGKTTFIKDLLKRDCIDKFFEKYTNEFYEENLNYKISISLIPLPLFRGSVKDFFNIFNIDLNLLLNLEKELRNLSSSIFEDINDQKTLNKISLRRIETFSAGEMRRLFILKSLLVESNFLIIDEPFSNSDEKLWDIIYKSINLKSRTIILSHFSLDKLGFSKTKQLFLDINEVRENFNFDK